MLQIDNIRMPLRHTEEDLWNKIRKMGVDGRREDLILVRKSLDARRKQDIHYLYTVRLPEGRLRRKGSGRRLPAGVHSVEVTEYRLPEPGSGRLAHRPLIVGTGPAGLFAGLTLAEAGYRPILIERGAPVAERTRDVTAFWAGGTLNPESNVQFGEGGAGTFSDGKLNTQIKDPEGRIHKVLSDFVAAGADPSLLYWHKPHVGTDVLATVVTNLRRRIEAADGEFRFHTKLADLKTQGMALASAVLENSGGREEVPVSALILAVGHSARDTFLMLRRRGIPLEAKSFAVGLRIEHPQEMIDSAQYGTADRELLPAADYKLTARASNGRGVYSFCMCPGGQVVNASSEHRCLAINGMSRSARDGRNANAALIVTVKPEDYPGKGALAGIAYQRQLEELAYREGQGQIPVQLTGDFLADRPSTRLGEVEPDLCGAWTFADLNRVLSPEISSSLAESMGQFGRKIAGFDRPDAVFSGVESRTSSPVRIVRDENRESAVRGLFPCGEGAGYAGGITSAAVDGMRTAEEIIRRYQPWI